MPPRIVKTRGAGAFDSVSRTSAAVIFFGIEREDAILERRVHRERAQDACAASAERLRLLGFGGRGGGVVAQPPRKTSEGGERGAKQSSGRASCLEFVHAF